MRLAKWLALVLLVVFVVSCSAKPEDTIVGKWSEVEGTETLEFFKDGTISLVSRGMPMGGSYKFVDTDRMKWELGGMGALTGPIIVTVSISGNVLTLTMPNGNVGKYKRTK